MINSFKIPQHFIRMVARGNSNACILVSEPGLSKSFMTYKTLKDENAKPIYRSGYITPLSLYTLLYNNRWALIVMDDLYGINNDKCVAILKSVLWATDGKRIVHYETTSNKIKDMDNSFEFEGQIIILTNKLNTNDINIQALTSRTLFHEFSLTYDEKISIMNKIVESPYKSTTLEQRKEVLDYIKEISSPVCDNFNFRTLINAYNFYLYSKDDWKILVNSIIKEDEIKKIVYELMNKKISVGYKIKIFFSETGMGRSTYYNILKKIK